MIKCASVYTYEIDDFDVAYDEIKTQLDEKLTLLDNTVGIVMCHPEFISSGALKAICERLPFDTAGVTTSSQAVNGVAGELILTIFVITSNDSQFRVGVTGEYGESVETSVMDAYTKASEGISDAPALALIFPTISTNYAGTPMSPHGGTRYPAHLCTGHSPWTTPQILRTAKPFAMVKGIKPQCRLYCATET